MNQNNNNPYRQGLAAFRTPSTDSPSSTSDTWNALAQLLIRPPVKGLYYNTKRLRLDGYSWEGCRFDKCVLEVNSSNFELIECIIDESTTIEYKGDTSKVIQLFLGRFQWAYENFPNFVPIRNPNGSITIRDLQK